VLVRDLIHDLKAGDVLQAIVGVLKHVALIVGVIAGAAAVAIGLVAGAAAAVPAAIVAGVALLVALALIGVRILLDRNDAVNAPDAGTFRRKVQDASGSLNEAVVTVVTTIIALITGSAAGRVARGGTGTELSPGSREQGGTRQGGQMAPPDPVVAPKPAARAPYDPTALPDAQVQLDVDPTPRPGETPAEATARAARATRELIERSAEWRAYEGLGGEPPTIDLAANDQAYGPPRAHPAHTLERHGPTVPLRRAAAPGARTVEGRLFGDAPWGRDANFSYRWFTLRIAQDTINAYLRANWETIRSDLATKGEFNAMFDARRAVGEGFYDANFGTPGPHAAPRPVYHTTSIVSLTLRLVPGAPPRIYVETAFPFGRGWR
jgi:hypothetical protein